ncbi:helix-turn-helix transcriptional regulator [Umezawaea beigongshangensis]|jgi:DNA-binding NarL/FixJ family response regulator|uniref:helix-turn-helix transcriptional regulator n=1 Tax=Umezawaea beigongshangensis TaxID=2780383 RepID=UPI0018F1622C|nr:response regulator transcription factor [Umezawaea beigongshangensis]
MRVVLRATDPITLAGLSGSLKERTELMVIPPQRMAEADVCVMATDRVTPEVVTLMRGVAAECGGPTVLVTGHVDPNDLLTAVECRVVAVLSRVAATPERLAGAIKAACTGRGLLPPDLLGELLQRVGRLQREVLAPNGLTASGLTAREIDVLRLMAEGWDTAEIADKLCYSDRTVKNIIYGMTKRLQLRNRSHAVAFALRAGVI